MKRYRANNKTVDDKEKKRIQMKKYRASKATAENKTANNAFVRNYRARKASPNQKVKHNAYMRAYRAKPKTNIELSISKFHEMIAEGPLYICSCCDQLWYKHAVLNAEKLRESNPGIGT